MKKINTWFKCEYPDCPNERDKGYEIKYKGKKIKVCTDCYKTLCGGIRNNTKRKAVPNTPVKLERVSRVASPKGKRASNGKKTAKVSPRGLNKGASSCQLPLI